MKFFIILMAVSVTSATFDRLFKPRKIYKKLVEPLVDVAVKGVVSGGFIEPFGHLIDGFGGKHKHPHHQKKHKEHVVVPHHQVDEPYHYHHEEPHYPYQGYGYQKFPSFQPYPLSFSGNEPFHLDHGSFTHEDIPLYGGTYGCTYYCTDGFHIGF